MKNPEGSEVAGEQRQADAGFTMMGAVCAVCRKPDAIPLFVGADLKMGLPGCFEYVRCQCCGLEYLNPRPLEVNAWYPANYYRHYGKKSTSPFRRWRLYRRAAWVREAIRGTAGRVLEIGCGDGEFLEKVRRLGMDTEGLDFSRTAVALARQRGLRVQQGSVEEASYPAEHFDLVVMRHVLEHLADPAAVLEIVGGWLRPVGHIMIEVPNRDSLQRLIFRRFWEGYDPPRHLYAFAPKDLAGLLDAAGFQVIWLRQLLSPAVWVDSFQNLRVSLGLLRPGWATRPARLALVMLAFYPLALLEVALQRGGNIAVLAARR